MPASAFAVSVSRRFIEMKSIPELFSSCVFNDTIMQARLPEDVYKALKKTMSLGTRLELEVANVVANAMKDWEIGRAHV